ncbi:MAG TPA: RluA family pseudouridine synthase [Vicinamibacterales bacterium]|nr:RluA family pseudouridine synthase [Vicinamibacterales bacterium]
MSATARGEGIPATHHVLLVSTDEGDVRIDRYLTGVLSGTSRSQIQRLIKDGKVTIAGEAVSANRIVKGGEAIAVEIPPPVSPRPQPEDHDLDIVYQDADLIVVNKPAGMVVHPAAGHADGTLVNALLHEVNDLSGVGGELRPGIVHRLDRGTSGLMVVAKNDRAHLELSRQFHDREVEKEYIALVWGVVQAGKRIDLPIGRDPGDRKKMSAKARRARSAVTRITAALHMEGVTLIHVAIATGRTHQIRVHLSEIGHPIVGDGVYGGLRRRVAGDLRPLLALDRPFLHAGRLAFVHPTDGRKMEFEAPLPHDLQLVLDQILPDDYERSTS